MAVREVLRYPHPSLKREARDLGPDDGEVITAVARDLMDTMESFGHCVGIAAPQLDHLVRMIAVDVTGHKKATTQNGLLLLVNPVIVATEGAEVGREGCLSIPHLTANVRRATTVRVEATTPEGNAVAVESEAFEARCLQHEIDHLDGLLFLDRVESVATDVFRRKNYGG
ncbi:MAG TPA: peptide deformylase [Thermoleophilaceae bacterium]|nr:peptide deformylase [Thermoleophilaceae bacterium]